MKTPRFHLDHIFKELEIEEIDAVESAVLPQPFVHPDVETIATENTQSTKTDSYYLASEIASYPLDDLAKIVFYRLHNKLLLNSINVSEIHSKLILPAGKGFVDAFSNKVISDLEAHLAQHKYEFGKSEILQHPGIKDPMFILSAAGYREEQEFRKKSMLQPGMKIVLVNPLAALPVLLLTELYGEKIRSNFDPEFYKWCREIKFMTHISGKSFMRFRRKFPVNGHYSLLGEGGLAIRCYSIAEHYNLGIEIDLARVPMLTPTKLLCDLFRLDPLSTDSSGCLMAVLDDSGCDALLSLCSERKIPAALIGGLTDKHNSCLFSNFEGVQIRMFNPEFDELHRFRYDLLEQKK
ncbi:MAG: hypothetical protein H6696_06300 [Deferribacteres bacterium]|nr:hypothetical protein [candidate division KSB1 bacterium]MCB9501530.1 hypothetical protein [Deferribacteres bacterium]